MSKKTLRVYLIRHESGRVTGILMRTATMLFDTPPPSAFGDTEDEVLGTLETRLLEQTARGQTIDRYLWGETMHTREVTVRIHPQTPVAKQTVIGKKEIPLRLTYAYYKMPGGSYRVLLPRFGWSFVLEDLDIAGEVLRQTVSSALLGENARWVYEFRKDGDEIVREFHPRLLDRDPHADAGDEEDSGNFPTLKTVADALVEKAARGKLPPIVDAAAFDLQVNLDRDPMPSYLLVGAPGAGKTTAVRKLAKTLAQRRRDKSRRQRRLWSTSGDRLIAGMVYLGMWQERCLKVVSELSHEGDFLFVDRLTGILKQQPDGSSIAEIFLPAVAAEEISLIAECTPAELERARRMLPQLVSQFKLVHIEETPGGAMPAHLDAYQQKRSSPVRIHLAGLKRLAQHLESFQPDMAFPGKGFRFLDWLASEWEPGRPKLLYAREASASFSRWSGLPLSLISDEFVTSTGSIARELTTGVIGQDRAAEIAARVLARFKAGMNDPSKPVGSLLFVGPTGVGKTELAKQLARTMFGSEERMIRLDMSEYMLSGAAQRMLDVGEGATSLAQRVRQQPLSLVLLDEIEKAHHEVFDLLLGILGEGRMTDLLGRHVDFRGALVVMTSNLGVSESAPIGFGDAPAGGDVMRAVRDHFRPEFFARLDHVVGFRALGPDDVLRIVDLELAKAGARTGLLRREVRLDVSAAAKRLLAQLGYHPTRGARPLKRVLEERVMTPVAVRLASEPSLRACTLPVVVADERRDGAIVVEE